MDRNPKPSDAVQVGQVVETSSGWLLDISEIKWWGDDDGAVYGRAFSPARGGNWSPQKYIPQRDSG